VSGAEVLVAKVLSPPYSAVVEWLPAERVVVAKLAVPSLRAPIPNVVVPSLKVTVPAGMPEPPVPEVTVAVNVTDCPRIEGFDEESTTVAVTKRQSFGRIETLEEPRFAAARSCLPSPLKSPTAIEAGLVPAL
jgi:hypothetical protein